jgi:hypothetical protein
MPSIIQTITDALQAALSGDPGPPPAILDGVDLSQLSAVSTDWSDLTAWLNHLDQITSRPVLDTLIVRAIQQNAPRVAEALTFLGIITAEYVTDSTRLHHFTLDRNRLNALINDPASVAGDINWWLGKAGNPESLSQMQVFLTLLVVAPDVLVALEYKKEGFLALPAQTKPVTGSDLARLIEKLVNSPTHIPLPSAVFPAVDDLLAALSPAPHASVFELDAGTAFPEGLSLTLRLEDVQAAVGKTARLGDWVLSFASDAGGGQEFRIAYTGGTWQRTDGNSTAFTLTLRKQPAANSPALVIGDPDGTRLEAERAALSLRLLPTGKEGVFSLGAELEQAALAVSTGLLRILSAGLALPDNLRFTSDIKLDYLQGVGFGAQGSPNAPALGLHFAKPLTMQIGTSAANLTLERVTVHLEKQATALKWRLALRTSASAQFGPMRLIMDGAGAWFGRWDNDQALGALAPDGIGLTIRAGIIEGGGFLAVSDEGRRFAGALTLKLLAFNVFAFGILTKLKGDKLSFVAVIGVRFPGGIQLGFGFMVTGVGGLIGINRRANTDLLRERLASGASGNVLFCDDPVKNAPNLLGDLDAFFPPEPDVFIIGPTLQLSWMAIVRLDVGVFIELPGPRKIFIAGSARVVIGISENAALVFLRMDFIGGIDFTQRLIFFDAQLVNSHVLGMLSITGGIAFRLAYGSPGYFVLTVGGFHPGFNPEPMNVPSIARVGAALSVNVVAEIWMRLEMYVAFTSNTFQVGANIEAGMVLGPISAHGWFRFDALIQFDPFYFEAAIDAGFDLEAAGISIASARVEGTLVGPGPVVIHARASIKRLFIKVSGSATFRLGDDNGDKQDILPSAFPALLDEIKTQNLRAAGDDPDVILRPDLALPADGILVAPVGSLIWEQKRAPLKTDLERFGGYALARVERFDVTSDTHPLDPKPEEDQFAAGTFTHLDQSEALNNATFQPLPSGVRALAGDPAYVGPITPDLTIDLFRVPELTRNTITGLLAPYLNGALVSMLRERHTVPPVSGGAAKVRVSGETWTAYSTDGSPLAEAQSPIQAFQTARRWGGFAVPATDITVDLTGV